MPVRRASSAPSPICTVTVGATVIARAVGVLTKDLVPATWSTVWPWNPMTAMSVGAMRCRARNFSTAAA